MKLGDICFKLVVDAMNPVNTDPCDRWIGALVWDAVVLSSRERRSNFVPDAPACRMRRGIEISVAINATLDGPNKVKWVVKGLESLHLSTWRD